MSQDAEDRFERIEARIESLQVDVEELRRDVKSRDLATRRLVAELCLVIHQADKTAKQLLETLEDKSREATVPPEEDTA